MDSIRLHAYLYDPVAFAHDCFIWREGQRLTEYQEEILASIVSRKRASARGPHGLGKTAVAAISVLWFSLTRDADGIDWKLPTTASAWRQLAKYLWPEIHKWARRLNWSKLGREPFKLNELQKLSLSLNHGEAFAVASNNHALIEGAHADSLLYLFDEAKEIPPATWDAVEGAFSGAGTDTKSEAFALAVSTPGPPNGRFYDIHRKAPGYEDWWARHVTLEETIAAGRVSAEWAEQRRKQWGEKSAVYMNRVAGEFCSSDEAGVIPLDWIERANERWYVWRDSGESAGALTHLGVDVAWTGKDASVVALRHGLLISALRRFQGEDPTQIASRSGAIVDGELRHKYKTDEVRFMRAKGAEIIVDAIGLGAGTYSTLLNDGYKATAFVASAGTVATDRTQEFRFVNQRSAAWWHLRELLDPEHGEPIALPPDDMLTGDLTAPSWRVVGDAKIQVESKEELRKPTRLGRSTDDGDAVVQAFAGDVVAPKVPIFSVPEIDSVSSWAGIR